MENKYPPTIITDNFPMKDLECQFYEICKHYNPDKCGYGEACNSYLLLDGNIRVRVRNVLRHSIEKYVQKETLELEIKTILEDRKS